MSSLWLFLEYGTAMYVIQLGLGCELIVCFEHKKNITLCFDAMISGTLVKMTYFANLWRVEINRQLIEAVFY